MTYYGAMELAASFRTVRGNTIQTARDIPEEQYGFIPAPDTRSVEKALTHIALNYRFQYQLQAVEKRSRLEGFDFFGLMDEVQSAESRSRTKAEVVDLLEREGEVWARFLDGLSEDFLAEQVQMMPGTTPAAKSRLELILSVKEHEMHHRGQLMLTQRMLGIEPHLTRQRRERMAQARSQGR